MSNFRYVVADVFTDTPLAGNQLAVFTDARELPEELLQPLAREINFSETVFVLPPEQGGHARIRIFTPATELPFAGHPMLGTAFVLAAPLQLGEIRLETGAGIVPVALERDETGRIVFGRMEQPIPTVEPYERRRELLAALGVEGSELPVELYDNGIRHVYVALGVRGRGRRAEAGPRAARRLLRVLGVNCFAGSGIALEDADVRAGRRRRRGPGDRLGGRPARRATSPGTAASPSATRSRSRRAPRSAARRRSTRGSRARRTRSSASRSAARP